MNKRTVAGPLEFGVEGRSRGAQLVALNVRLALALVLLRGLVVALDVDRESGVFVLSTLLGWLVLGGLVLSLARVLEALREGRLTRARVFLTWSSPLVALLGVLAVLRPALDRFLASPETQVMTSARVGRLAQNAFLSQLYAGDVSVHARWLERWQSGQILGLELGVILALALSLAFLGRRFGGRAALPGALTVAAGILAATYFGGLLWWTHDLYHMGVLLGFLALDLSVLAPLAWQGSVVAALGWLVLALSQAELGRRVDAAR